MQLKASIDESDLGNIKEGQAVTFRVDAYPNDVFSGTVQQVRLNPVIESNVVTYAAIVSAPNAELKLKPGMTATLTVEVARRDNVLRVPSAALRFKPTAGRARRARSAAGRLGSRPARADRRATGVKPAGDRGPAVPQAGHGTVWILRGRHMRPLQVTTGATDGSFTEIVDGDVREGTTLAMRVTMPGAAAARPAPSSRRATR